MSQWAHEHPELAEQGLDALSAYTDFYDAYKRTCLTCGEPTRRGQTRCERCKRNIEEDRLNREQGL